MIGLIPKVLVDYLNKNHGKDVVRRIFKQANISSDRTYKMNLLYDDAEWRALFQAFLSEMDISDSDANKIFASEFMSYVLFLFPQWFEMATDTYEFLKLQPKIHNSFSSGLSKDGDKKRVRDKFYLEEDKGTLSVFYSSPNKHCGLYIELINCLSQHYQDKVLVRHEQCMLGGDSKCLIKVIRDRNE